MVDVLERLQTYQDSQSDIPLPAPKATADIGNYTTIKITIKTQTDAEEINLIYAEATKCQIHPNRIPCSSTQTRTQRKRSG
ncbi:hypothetical protein AVEN_159388-1 [Araneus ventricosus]|uniref:Uncharacterized protein n=1 Tax=Araneus ventricosus TaxID=182803 RepID=A0A4Y2A1W4_ARAVE|nr:hypothetical protein AVEN_159388-1 [Araneus ventricosus]